MLFYCVAIPPLIHLFVSRQTLSCYWFALIACFSVPSMKEEMGAGLHLPRLLLLHHEHMHDGGTMSLCYVPGT